MGDVTKADGTVVQEEQTREIFGARDGAFEKVDDMTVRLNLAGPDISIVPNFADYPALIVHRGFDEAGGDLTTAPVGTGPWELVSTDVGVRAVYQKRTNGTWWGDAVADLGPVYLDGVEFIDYGTDPSAEISAYEFGRDPHELRDAGELRRDLRCARAGEIGSGDRQHALRTDERDAAAVRQPGGPQRGAARRRQQSSCSTSATRASARLGQNHHVGPMHPEYAELPPISRDPEKAKQMMADAGHAATELELISLDDDINRNTCDAVAAQLRDAGINVKRTVLPGNTYWNNWTGYPFSSTEWNMRPLGVQVYALAYRSGEPWNETGFANEEFDTLLAEAYAIADADQRRAVMEKMEKIIQDSGIIVQPYWRSTFRHMTEAVNGLVMHPTFEIHLENTWLTA